MRIPAVAALSLVVVLGACGGGEGNTPKATPTPTPTKASATPEASQAPGKPAPQDLAAFRCAKDKKGHWNATAVVKNSTKTAQDYRITVHVGPAEGEASPARTQSVGRVNASGSVTVKVLKIPAASPDGPCQVQLVASPV